ncbi:hypothetical protein FRC02_010218, partial [Tulasnella sp. 418]
AAPQRFQQAQNPQFTPTASSPTTAPTPQEDSYNVQSPAGRIPFPLDPANAVKQLTAIQAQAARAPAPSQSSQSVTMINSIPNIAAAQRPNGMVPN